MTTTYSIQKREKLKLEIRVFRIKAKYDEMHGGKVYSKMGVFCV